MATRLATKKEMAGWGVVFPGYPVQRGVALVEDKWRKNVLARAKAAGFVGKPLPGVGHDYNYHGALYRFTKEDA